MHGSLVPAAGQSGSKVFQEAEVMELSFGAT
jgi:hypothetical protein